MPPVMTEEVASLKGVRTANGSGDVSSNKKQARLCTYNLTLRRVHEIIFAVEKQ
jgi:hypothetical protein